MTTMAVTDQPSEITLRAAGPGDIEAIATVWYHGWLDGHPGHVPATLRRHRRPVDFLARVPARLERTTVSTVKSRLVGFVTLHDDEVEQLYVAEAARGTGVAAALLRHGEQVIAGRFDLAWLAVVAGNTRARRFYGRQGWSDAGAIDYAAETGTGTFSVPSRRYEKRVTGEVPVRAQVRR